MNQPSSLVSQLLAQHQLISDQVDAAQVRVILGELERILVNGQSGAVVEFGCYIGTTSLFIRRLLDAHDDDREFHVYDSFEGLPPKSAQDASGAGEQFQAGELAVSKKQFIREFQKANLPAPIIHKCWFDALSPADVPSEIAFAFLDGDFYESIGDSLRIVIPRTQPGGTIVIDDYAREALPGAAKAVHEFFEPSQMTTAYNLGIIRL